jgi:hypothetical protein
MVTFMHYASGLFAPLASTSVVVELPCSARRVFHEPGDEFLLRHLLEASAIGEQRLDRFGLLRREVRGDRGLEFLNQHRHPRCTALAVTDRVVHRDTRRRPRPTARPTSSV